jgi:hypothetical protein
VLSFGVVVIGVLAYFLIDPPVKFVNESPDHIAVSIRQGPLGFALKEEVEPYGEYSFNPNMDHGFYLFASKIEDHIDGCKYEYVSCCDTEKPSCKSSGVVFSRYGTEIVYSSGGFLSVDKRPIELKATLTRSH